MADDEPQVEMQEVHLSWNLPTGPPPLVSQFLLHPVPDADGGPAEILVHLGYAVIPPGDRRSDPNSQVPITTVASFALTRHRAEQLKDFLSQQIAQWDRMAASVRKDGTDDD
jgi:hypothetical protein